MRHPLPSLLTSLILLTVLSIPMTAQPIDSVRPVVIVDSSPMRAASVHYMVAASPVAVTNLNGLLAENGFGENRFTTGFLDGARLSGTGLRAETSRWTLGMDILSSSPETISSNDTRITHSFWQFQVSGGYLAMASTNFRLFPFASLGLRFNNLEIRGTQERSFKTIFNDSDRDVDLSNGGGVMELGAGTEYSFRLIEEEPRIIQLAFGLRGGYLIGLNDTWYGISEGPAMSASGAQLALTVGIRIIPRIYQATILSERAPE